MTPEQQAMLFSQFTQNSQLKQSADFRNDSQKSPTIANVINESINTKTSLNRSKNQNQEEEKRLTFNPDQYAGLMRTQQKNAQGQESLEQSGFILEKSKEDISNCFY